MFKWTEATEDLVLKMREARQTYKEIALLLDTTESSVKHKVGRLRKADNHDRYKHTAEKLGLYQRWCGSYGDNVLETHCGFGSMTEHYTDKVSNKMNLGRVMSFDIKQDRVDYVRNLNLKHVHVTKIDSEKAIYSLVHVKAKYDIIDIDPYGFPSRYFPHVFNLMDDGILFLTFPMMGVAQMNKITIQHLKSFWDIELSDKDVYVDKIKKKLFDYAFMCKRSIEVLEVMKIDRVYRFAIKVKKESLLKIVGLKVNR